MDAFHEVRSIGQIEIVNAVGDTGFDDPMPTLPVSLKRPAGIDENMGPERDKVRREVAVPVEGRGDEPGLGCVARFAVGACTVEPATYRTRRGSFSSNSTIRPPNVP
jgi:hypothetical protein